MVSKLFLSSKLSYALMGISLVCAGAISHETRPHKPVQFYLGVSGGLETLSGRRNEVVLNNTDPQVSTFADNKSLSSRNGQYALFGGFSVNIPNVPIFIGPEIYLGRGHTARENSGSFIDTGNNTFRHMKTIINQSDFVGGIIQAGVNLSCQYRAFFLLGGDISKFRYSTFFVPRSALAFGALSDLPAASFATNKWLRGFVWGLGVDKQYKCFRFGADIRFMTYRTFKASYTTNSGDPIDPIDTINNSFKPRHVRFSLKLSYLF